MLSMLLQGSADASGAQGGDEAVRNSSPAVSAVADTTCAPSPPAFPGTDIRLDPADIATQAWWSQVACRQAGPPQCS